MLYILLCCCTGNVEIASSWTHTSTYFSKYTRLLQFLADIRLGWASEPYRKIGKNTQILKTMKDKTPSLLHLANIGISKCGVSQGDWPRMACKTSTYKAKGQMRSSDLNHHPRVIYGRNPCHSEPQTSGTYLHSINDRKLSCRKLYLGEKKISREMFLLRRHAFLTWPEPAIFLMKNKYLIAHRKYML